MPRLLAGPARVRVPASSANLGPGFDSLGLALTLYDEVTVEVLPEGTGPVIDVEGEGADDVPRDSSHLVHRSLARGLAEMGLDAPAVRLGCRNAIPHGRGLGSSSAAIVAGLAAGRALVDGGARLLDDDAMFALAAELEGHPDNVAPAVYGGFTVSYTGAAGPRAVRMDVTSALAFVALVPPEPLSTTVARGLLPETVPHRDAAANAGRAALLVAALTGHPELVLAATEDRLHQSYRAPAMPASLALIGSLRADGIAAVVSGAGPTVLALAADEQVASVTGRIPSGWRALRLEVDTGGVRQVDC